MQAEQGERSKVVGTFTKKLETTNISNLNVHMEALETKTNQTHLSGLDDRKCLKSGLNYLL